ncbi:MAG: hypothetical protein NTU61_00280, partial [Candidatus Altiarchaeota archaeon]|nr:hypothetical protein [Candidatus Altiarchaeota archaeon]
MGENQSEGGNGSVKPDVKDASVAQTGGGGVIDESIQISNRHLLGLVVEYDLLTDVIAARKLSVPVEQVRTWANELLQDGWIAITEGEFGVQEYALSKDGKGRMKEMRKEISFREKDVETKVKVPMSKQIPQLILKLTGIAFLIKFVRRSYMDIMMVSSVAYSIYLLYQFIKQPNDEALSFFMALLVFSITIFLYNQYRKYLRSGGVIGFL